MKTKWDFVGRNDELKRLSTNFLFSTASAIVAPRGWGKTSLIARAAEDAFRKEKNLRFCHVDLSVADHEDRFYELLAGSVIRSVSASREDAISNIRKYLPGLNPKIGIASDSIGDLTIHLSKEDIRDNRILILDLPHSVAIETGLKLVVCIDDFHRISGFHGSEEFAASLASRWKRHEKVTYCITGEGNAAYEKFIRTSPMFYRYGEVIRLGPVMSAEMIKFLRDSFADTAKYLDNEIAALLIDKVRGNPFYVLRLAHMSWLGTSVVCSREVVEEAFETITDQMILAFETITKSLTVQQLCYLKAISSGETVISTSDVMHRYHITSATSASRSKSALLELGMICVMDGRICFSDPVYESWLRRQ